MGNLLGAPVTEKETHVGRTNDELLHYGVSSMQGWRVHMEDAHIAEPRLYAVNVHNGNQKIGLPGHALFAVFDGHGGKFAAAYAGRNLCRVLSRQPKFLEYAQFEQERPAKEKTFTKSQEFTQNVQAGLNLLEQALCDAFVELDREIACALKGQKVAQADQPYNEDEEENHGGSPNNDAAAGQPNSAAADPATAAAQQSPFGAPGASSVNPNDDNSANNDNGSPLPVNDEDDENPADAALRLLPEEGDSGTTACVVVITPEWVICANAGDSRSVMSKLGNRVVPLSYDHKPDDDAEEKRIRAAGGYVAGGRVEGDLAVSRGLGDFRFKNMDVVMNTGTWSQQQQPSSSLSRVDPSAVDDDQENVMGPADESITPVQQQQIIARPEDQKVSPIPDIIVQNRNRSQDEFIIIACDGIWDVQTNYEGVKTVAELFQEGESNIGLVCEEVSTHGVGQSS